MFRFWLPLLGFLFFLWSGAEINSGIHFSEVSSEAGITWRHINGKTPEKYLIETMGGGGAFLDYDNDGLMDIFLVNSGGHKESGQTFSAQHALYRNLGDGRFTDVTNEAGVARSHYGMGVAVGDFDNDGWQDLYVTAFGRNTLYRNQGDGSFEDITEQAGVGVGLWSTSAAFFDLENDGDLDLFVCVYLDWDYDKNIYCGDREAGKRSYCHPNYFGAIPSVLFRNNGDGTFTDITTEAGLDLPGKALGVVAGDLTGDDLADLYVANDAVANYLYLNQENGIFLESGLMSEVAYGMTARPESGMGTDMGDFNSDGWLDLIVTNIDNEHNNLYLNDGDGFFSDVTVTSGLGRVALLLSGFGVRFFDPDLDSDQDLVVLNGHVVDNVEYYKPQVDFAEPPLLLENQNARFRSLGSAAGEIFDRKLVGRALAAGDYDNDGRIDLLFVNNNGAPNLLHNDSRVAGKWIGFHLQGSRSNRDAVGALIEIETKTGWVRGWRLGGGSYQAAHDPRLVFGLASDAEVKKVVVKWPGGGRQEVRDFAMGRYNRVVEQSP